MVVVTFKMPESLVQQLDQAVTQLDSDRSKFGRTAIREKLAATVAR